MQKNPLLSVTQILTQAETTTRYVMVRKGSHCIN